MLRVKTVCIGIGLAASWMTGSAFADDAPGRPGNGPVGAQAPAPARPGAPASAPASAQAAATPAGGSAQVLQGRVEQMDMARNLRIAGSERVGLAFEKFKLAPDAEITVDGRRASIDDLHEGDEVRASFSRDGEELQVRRLDIVSGATTAGTAPAPSTPSSVKSGPGTGTTR
jgi:hypothetical protein